MMKNPSKLFRLCIRRNKIWVNSDSASPSIKIEDESFTNLKPEERLLLFRLVSKMTREAEPFSWSVRDVAMRFDASASTAQKLIKKLKLAGLIVRDELNHGLGHRSKEVYKLSSAFNDMLSGYKSATSFHASLQDRLIYDRRASGLQRSSIWFLCVLLENANQCGVVKHLSYAQLELMAGMSVHQVRSQINTLKQNNFLHSVVPGQKRAMFNISKASIYFLNIRHDFFDVDRRSGFTFELTVNCKTDEFNTLTFSKNLTKVLIWLSDKWGSESPEFEKNRYAVKKVLYTCLREVIAARSLDYFEFLTTDLVGQMFTIADCRRDDLENFDLFRRRIDEVTEKKMTELKQELLAHFTNLRESQNDQKANNENMLSLSSSVVTIELNIKAQHELVDAVIRSILITAKARATFFIYFMNRKKLDLTLWRKCDVVEVAMLDKTSLGYNSGFMLEFFLRKNGIDSNGYSYHHFRFLNDKNSESSIDGPIQRKQLLEEVASRSLPKLKINYR